MRRSSCRDYLKAYELQIIWIILFIILQLFLYGMGVLQYTEERKITTRASYTLNLVAMGFGNILQFNCGILVMFPALRWTFGYLRRTRLARIVPFDSLISFHVILGFTIGVAAICHFTIFIIYFCMCPNSWSSFEKTAVFCRSEFAETDEHRSQQDILPVYD